MSTKIQKVLGAILTIALILVSMPIVLADDPPEPLGDQDWYLTDATTGKPPGADYIMYKDSGGGNLDILIDDGESKVWAADEAQAGTGDYSGTWTGTIRARSGGTDVGFATVCIGVLSSGTFTPKGSTSIYPDNQYFEDCPISITTSGHTINAGERLALEITDNFIGVEIDVTGSNSPSYIHSPSGADDYPIPEFSTMIIPIIGMIALFAIFKKYKK